MSFEPRSFVCPNVVRVRQGSTRRVSLLLIVSGLFLLLGAGFMGPLAFLIGYPVLVIGGVTLLRHRTHPVNVPHHGGYPGVVKISEESVAIEAVSPVEIPRWEIAQGWILPSPTRPDVMLETKDGDAYALEVASMEEGEALLEAAGVSAERRIVTMRLSPVTRKAWLGCLVLVVTILATPIVVGLIISIVAPITQPTFGTFVLVFLFGLLAVAIAELSTPPSLTVGLDGLRLRTPLRSRYIPHAQIRDLEDTQSGLALLLEDNRRVELAALRTAGRADAADGLRVLLRRVLSASSRRKSSSRAAEVLDRRGERFDDWKARLARLTSSLGYREGTLDAEALADVVDDAQSPVERRLGAAIALAKSGGDAGRARVRVAADATADLDLRAALEAAAEEELTDEMASRVIERRR